MNNHTWKDKLTHKQIRQTGTKEEGRPWRWRLLVTGASQQKR